MKIRIELDETTKEDEVIIKCQSLNKEIQDVQKVLTEMFAKKQQITFFKGDKAYYLSLESILFFETDVSGISAHTADQVYEVKHKLYELEEMLPGSFMRVSKSTILNTNQIYAMTHNLSSNEVQFQGTHKQVYVSRHYYKPLKFKLLEKRK